MELYKARTLLAEGEASRPRETFEFVDPNTGYEEEYVIPLPGDIIEVPFPTRTSHILVVTTDYDDNGFHSFRGYELSLRQISAYPTREDWEILSTAKSKIYRPGLWEHPYEYTILDYRYDRTAKQYFDEDRHSKLAKVSKEKAGYIDPPPTALWPDEGRGIRCGTCTFFDEGRCTIVAGKIHEQGCCNLWSYEGLPAVEGMASGEEIANLLDW